MHTGRNLITLIPKTKFERRFDRFIIVNKESRYAALVSGRNVSIFIYIQTRLSNLKS